MIPKFRVFDSKFKEMEEVYLIDWQWPEQDAWINDNPSDDLIFMQSTGLHNKNGVEIFEGDVVKFRDKIYQIEFNKYRFKAKGFWLTYQDVPDDFFSEGAYKHCEVIGNVHENPELLGE